MVIWNAPRALGGADWRESVGLGANYDVATYALVLDALVRGRCGHGGGRQRVLVLPRLPNGVIESDDDSTEGI